MPEFRSRYWDWWRDVRIGEDFQGGVRLQYNEVVRLFRPEEPISELLKEIRKLDLKLAPRA